MSLAFDRERTTRDVDARIDTGHSRLVEAVRKVGRRHGLGDAWLNDQAPPAIPRAADGRAETGYQSRHLTVTGASSKHLLAMKLLAARGKDREDIAVLCKRLGLKGPEEAIRIYKELFPDEKLKESGERVSGLGVPHQGAGTRAGTGTEPVKIFRRRRRGCRAHRTRFP